MSVRTALRRSVAATYRCSWRLLAVNTALSAVAIAVGLAMPTVPLALLLAPLAAGPFAAALASCAVTLARDGELSLRDGVEGLRLHWRTGLALGGLFGAGLMLCALALGLYGSSRETWPFAALAVYVAAVGGVVLLTAWPIAIAEPETGVAGALRSAWLLLLRRPGRTLALGLVLLLVNAVGALAVLPLLTLTIAFSFLVAAHVVLPLPDPAPEEPTPWPA
jgi:hypothetical protein